MGVAALVGLALRAVAARASLWMDELHSLGHGLQPDLMSVFDHTHFDFHAPLFFTAVHFVADWSSPHAGKILPISASLLALVPACAIARSAGASRRGVALAAWFLCAMPFFVYYGQELRPYAFLGLATTSAAWAAWTDDGSTKKRFAIFAIATAFGLNTHYLMVLAVPAIMIGAFISGFRASPVGRLRPLALVGAAALGATCFLPWMFGWMSWVVESPAELVPHETNIPPIAWRELVESPIRIIVPRIDSLGDPWDTWALVGAASFLLAAFAAVGLRVVAPFRRNATPATPTFKAALTTTLILLPVTGFLSVKAWGRVGLQYHTLCAFLVPILVAVCVDGVRAPRVRGTLIAMLALGATIGGIAQSFGAPREDLRAAVERVRSEVARRTSTGTPPPWVSAVMRQPDIFDHTMAFTAYGRDLGAVEPSKLPTVGEPGFDRPVVLLVRRWDDLERAENESQEAIRKLTVGRVVAERIPIDDGVGVWILAPKP